MIDRRIPVQSCTELAECTFGESRIIRHDDFRFLCVCASILLKGKAKARDPFAHSFAQPSGATDKSRNAMGGCLADNNPKRLSPRRKDEDVRRAEYFTDPLLPCCRGLIDESEVFNKGRRLYRRNTSQDAQCRGNSRLIQQPGTLESYRSTFALPLDPSKKENASVWTC